MSDLFRSELYKQHRRHSVQSSSVAYPVQSLAVQTNTQSKNMWWNNIVAIIICKEYDMYVSYTIATSQLERILPQTLRIDLSHKLNVVRQET